MYTHELQYVQYIFRWDRILCFRSFQSSRVPRLLCWKAELATFLNAAAKNGWPTAAETGNPYMIYAKKSTFQSTFFATQTYFHSIVQVPLLPVLLGTSIALWISGSLRYSVRNPNCSCGLTERKVTRLQLVSVDFGISPSHSETNDTSFNHGLMLNTCNPPHVFIYLRVKHLPRIPWKHQHRPYIQTSVTDSSRDSAERCSSGALDDRNIWFLSSAICRNVLLSQVCSSWLARFLFSWWWRSTIASIWFLGAWKDRVKWLVNITVGSSWSHLSTLAWLLNETPEAVGLSPRVTIHLEFQGRLNQNIEQSSPKTLQRLTRVLRQTPSF